MQLDNEFSNFKILGIGKESQGQKDRRAKAEATLKKLEDDAKGDINDAQKKLNKAAQDAKVNIHAQTKDWKSISHSWNKFNPAATVPRAAGLALVRLNFLGIARKLHAGLISDAELKAKHYDLDNAAIVRKVWETTVKDNWEALGGDISALKKAVLKGFDKPIFKTKKIKAAKRAEAGQSFDGGITKCEQAQLELSPLNRFANEFDFSEEESKRHLPVKVNFFNSCDAACVGAFIAAGGAVVTASINAAAKKAGAKDNPYIPNTPEYNNVKKDPAPVTPPFTPQDDATLKAIELAALEDRKKNGLDANTYDAEYKAIENKYDKIWGISKPWFYGGVTVLSLAGFFGIYKLYKHFNK